MVSGADLVAQRDGVELHDRAINGKSELGAGLIKCPHGGPHFVGRAGKGERLQAGQTPRTHLRVKLPLGGRPRNHGLPRTPAVKNNRKPALRDLARIKLLQRAGGQIARMGIRRFSGRFALSVDAPELHPRQKDFPAQFDRFGHRVRRAVRIVCAQLARQASDRERVGGDIVALDAVAASDRADETTLLVSYADRQTVELGLDHIYEIISSQLLRETGMEAAQFGFGVTLGETLHPLAVAIERKRTATIVTDRLGIGHSDRQPGELLFQRREFTLQRIVSCVADLGRGFLVVQFVVVGDFEAQGHDPFTRFLGFERRRIGTERCDGEKEHRHPRPSESKTPRLVSRTKLGADSHNGGSGGRRTPTGPGRAIRQRGGRGAQKKAPRGERSALKCFSDVIVRSAPT